MSLRLAMPASGGAPFHWLTPLEGKRLAGFTMWIPGGSASLAPVIVVALRALQRGARRSIITRLPAPEGSA